MNISPDGFVRMLSAYGQQAAFAAKFASDHAFAQECIDKLNRARNVPEYADVKSFGAQCRKAVKSEGNKSGFVPAKPKGEVWKVSEYEPGKTKAGRKAKTQAANAAEKDAAAADSAANAASWKVKVQESEKIIADLRAELKKARARATRAEKALAKAKAPAKARRARKAPAKRKA